MMFRTNLLAVLALVHLSSYGQENRWIKIFADDQLVEYLDTLSIQDHHEDITNAWFLSDFFKPQTYYGESKFTYDKAKKLYEVSCKKRKVRIVETIFYLGGTPVIHTEFYEISTFNNVVPQTLGETIWKSVCT